MAIVLRMLTLLATVTVAVAADLEWKYEGSNPEPVCATAISDTSLAMKSEECMSSVSDAYGTSESLFFYSFANSSGICALNAIFNSSKPIGMMVIFR
ncbi:MAG: hypothetical protein IKK82_10895 [Kiritimatiellae bacterium]|nr:hypothetical protein [Kiritimatiellia bacterium]